ncbi:MAG: hypothetical protein CMP28_09035 [Roseibacillus sp.]|nr:hypothetical protein [Roseibacillus sp.]
MKANVLVALLLGVLTPGLLAAGGRKSYSLGQSEVGHVLKAPDGRTVFQYMTSKPEGSRLTANSTCCFYPVMTPGGTRVVDFAPDDHPHHRGIFLAWYSMLADDEARAGDFWGWGKFAPTEGRVIRNDKVTLVRANSSGAALAINNSWMAGKTRMLTEELSVGVAREGEAYVMDLHFELIPDYDLVLGRAAFSGFNVKSRKSKGSYSDPGGKVGLAAPHYLKPETGWPSRPWYDYSFVLEDGREAGVTVIDHSDNPETSWHNLLPIAMLNPCIVAPQQVKLPANQPFSLRYRLLVHDGPVNPELAGKMAEGYARQ